MRQINLEKISKINCSIFADEDYPIFLANFKGNYGVGSKGNSDGLFIFSKVATAYYLLEPIAVIVLDFRALEYTFGNTLLMTLNFFREIGREDTEKEQPVVVITSDQNSQAINGLLQMTKKHNCTIFTDFDLAIGFARKTSERYFLN